MEIEDVPVRQRGQSFDISWVNSLREAIISSLGETTAAIANNQTAATLTGLIFDSGDYRAAFVKYTVKRIATATVMEIGELALMFDGTNWSIEKAWSVGNAEIDFSI